MQLTRYGSNVVNKQAFWCTRARINYTMLWCIVAVAGLRFYAKRDTRQRKNAAAMKTQTHTDTKLNPMAHARVKIFRLWWEIYVCKAGKRSTPSTDKTLRTFQQMYSRFIWLYLSKTKKKSKRNHSKTKNMCAETEIFIHQQRQNEIQPKINVYRFTRSAYSWYTHEEWCMVNIDIHLGIYMHIYTYIGIWILIFF